MHPGDESGHPGEVRVTDRRRFTDTGDARETSEASSEPRAAGGSEPGVAAGETPRATPDEAPAAATRRPPEPDAAAGPPQQMVLDLGIEAVFFVFYQSALIALGMPEAGGPPRPPDLAEARQAIEFLRVLESKTAGNLTAEEQETLRQLLDDAQLRYVHVARATAGGGA